jgi:hypothetical protein
MAKLTKQQRRYHEEALQRLAKGVLTDDDKEFVFKHYHEGANHNNGDSGAFFSSLELAYSAAHDCCGDGYKTDRRVVDLCAGIGVLAYALVNRYQGIQVVCVEANPDYVAVGKKLVPEAEWVCADVMDKDHMLSLGAFDYAISNPPFGKVASMKGKDGFYYTGAEAEYKVMDIASVMANSFCFIVPQTSANFRYSGVQYHEWVESSKYKTLTKETDIELDVGMGYDTTALSEDAPNFKDVNIRVEFVHAYTDHIDAPQVANVVELPPRQPIKPTQSEEQYDLFGEAS